MVLTKNEKKLLAFLWKNFRERLSINELSKQVNVTPKGAYKILKKFEEEDLVVKEKVANAAIYTLNFKNKAAEDIVKYVLKSQQAPNSYIKVLEKELESLQGLTKAMIVFGSVLTKGLKANDIDLLVVIEKKKFSELRKEVKEFEKVSPQKIHLVVQTEQDMKKNLSKEDAVVHKALKTGYILHGHNILYKLIKNDASR